MACASCVLVVAMCLAVSVLANRKATDGRQHGSSSRGCAPARVRCIRPLADGKVPVTTSTVDVERALRVLDAEWHKYAAGLHPAQRSEIAAGNRGSLALRSPAAPSPSIANVLACIRHAESGDYSEHSHPNDGTGAYQYIGPTWRAWSARAGYPGYWLAYEAPPAVQDAVTVYTLTHGGAHNWSPRYGNDPCTVGLP